MAKKRTETKPLASTHVSAPSPTRRVEIGTPDAVPTFYVNSVNFELSNWDIKLRLGQIQGGDESVLRVGEVARVFMSHTHARAFAAALNRMIEKLDASEQATPAGARVKAH